MTQTPPEKYHEVVAEFESTLQGSLDLSKACAGIRSPSGRHFYASVIFTSLCTRSVSIAILAPHGSWAEKPTEHWDYASIAALARSVLEVRIAFYYLCIDACSEEEWCCRLEILNIHDCSSRIKLFSDIPDSSDSVNGFTEQLEMLRTRIQANTHFQSLPANEKKQYLNGNKAYLEPLENIARRAGVDTETFRWLYKFLSSHVHGLPMSFYRMADQQRGRGMRSDVEEGYTKMCLSFVAEILAATCDEMREKFKDVSRNGA